MTTFMEGLDSSIELMVSQYRQDNRHVSFLRLVIYAKAHGTSVRARERKTHRITIEAPATLKNGSKKKSLHPVPKIRGAAHPAESRSLSDNRRAYGDGADVYEGDFVAEGDFIEESDGYCHEDYDLSGTSIVWTPTYTDRSDPVLLFGYRGHIPAPWIPM